MLDMKFVRENPELVMDAMRKRNANVNLDEFLELEKKRRELTLQVEALKSQRNAASQEIGKMKKAGENADAQMAEVRALGDKIAEDDKELKDIEARLKEILMTIPNMPAADTPVGSILYNVPKNDDAMIGMDRTSWIKSSCRSWCRRHVYVVFTRISFDVENENTINPQAIFV